MADERYSHAYVDADSTVVFYLEGPLGFVPPPMLEVHRPLVGPVTLYSVSGFRLPLPKAP